MFRSSSQGLGETLEFHKTSTLASELEERSIEKAVIQFQTKPDATFSRWSVSLRLGIGSTYIFSEQQKLKHNKTKQKLQTKPQTNENPKPMKQKAPTVIMPTV